jgi:hypothetical protein
VFLGILAVGAAGTIVARGRAEPMARAMVVTAAAQALVGAIVFLAGIGSTEPPEAIGLLLLIESFAALWFASAWLFARAARS